MKYIYEDDGKKSKIRRLKDLVNSYSNYNQLKLLKLNFTFCLLSADGLMNVSKILIGLSQIENLTIILDRNEIEKDDVLFLMKYVCELKEINTLMISFAGVDMRLKKIEIFG